MTTKKLIGIIILTAIFAGLFAITGRCRRRIAMDHFRIIDGIDYIGT